MSDIFTKVQKTLRETAKKKIVFPEATDERVLKAACRLAEEGLVEPVLIGKEEKIKEKAKQLQIDFEHCFVVDPHEYGAMDEMIEQFVERRNGKVTEVEAEEILK